MYKLKKSQINCQNALKLHNRCLIIKSIRSGKTLTILDYAKKSKYKSILWVVPNVDNIKELYKEMEKWNIKLNITPICYASLKNHTKESFDLIVLDEVHKLSELSLDYISNITYNKIIGMTGTYPNKKEKQELLHRLGLIHVYTYSILDAINEKNVAPFKINIIHKELSVDKNLKIEYLDKITKQKKFFYTSEKDSYNRISKKIEEELSGTKKKMLSLNRMRLLNTLPSTIDFIKAYIKENSDKRILIFVATQEMAEKCSEFCYHGNKNDYYFKLFQEEKINHLVLVEKATIGVTYNKLDGCLLTNINSSNTFVQQKIFRTVLFRPNYTANIDILINKSTMQETWLNKSLNI
jgi:superfamily II DNA or RNA helicase